jgi:hypothetical protein
VEKSSEKIALDKRAHAFPAGLGSPMRLYSQGPLVPHAATGKDK